MASKRSVKAAGYQRHQTFTAVEAGEGCNEPVGRPGSGRKPRQEAPTARRCQRKPLICKCYKTTCKQSQSPIVMIHIISKSSLYQHPHEKCIAVLKNCYKWIKLTEDSGFGRLRTMRWVLWNDPNNSIKDLTRFLWHSWERYDPFRKSRTEFSWKYNPLI